MSKSINMTDTAMKAEAKRRGFFYIGWIYKVYHPDKPKKTRRFELRYEAEGYIAHAVTTNGFMYASRLLVKKIVVDNARGNVNKASFVQWIKPVRDIKATVGISYSVEI